MNAFTVEMARKRADMMASVRTFFAEKGVLEVETPSLCSGIGPDCHIDPFETGFQAAPGSALRKRYLLSSPELPMKRLLASGFPDIFQLGRVYRNGEAGRLHNPEFTMLEWYRRGFDMYRLIDEVTEFLRYLLPGPPEVELLSYRELFMRHTGLDPLNTSVDAVRAILGEKNEEPEFSSLADALIYAIAVKVEPHLDADRLTIVYNYPKDQAVLSVVDRNDSRIARRFEAYFKGVELVNGFEELTDAEENRRRFADENRRRRAEGKAVLPVDERFLDAMAQGMSPCSGVAVGMDRVLMCMTGVASIAEVISFPWEAC
jgi:elongation factor P--(R)-beta-lysine ligase